MSPLTYSVIKIAILVRSNVCIQKPSKGFVAYFKE